MSHDFDSSEKNKDYKVNWAQECVIGAIVGTIFTAMAAHAGTDGVAEGSLSAKLHDLTIVGGIVMAVICGLAAVLILLWELVKHSLKTDAGSKAKGRRFSGNVQAVKFLKIFLP